MCEIGIAALNYKNDKNWYTDSIAKIEVAKKPRGQVELKVVEPIEKLINFTFNK